MLDAQKYPSQPQATITVRVQSVAGGPTWWYTSHFVEHQKTKDFCGFYWRWSKSYPLHQRFAIARNRGGLGTGNDARQNGLIGGANLEAGVAQW
jgi:hypothetical protein